MSHALSTCPKCLGEIPVGVVVCPHCGYDFPDNDPTLPRVSEGVSTSSFGRDFTNAILKMAAWLCGISSLASIIWTFIFMFAGQWYWAISMLGSVIIAAALCITFVRAMEKD
ncbi:hypothetical protein EON80_29175 [bacterium]|nr:MAG: hypothetical protein EON80_29175 [bacterium]